jgi:hypothetical protein
MLFTLSHAAYLLSDSRLFLLPLNSVHTVSLNLAANNLPKIMQASKKQ